MERVGSVRQRGKKVKDKRKKAEKLEKERGTVKGKERKGESRKGTWRNDLRAFVLRNSQRQTQL